MAENQEVIINVDSIPPESSCRLDIFLKDLYKDISRQKITRWVQKSQVKLNGQIILKKGIPLKYGDVLSLTLPTTEESSEPEKNEYSYSGNKDLLDIMYEDDDLMVLNKPAGLVVHPGIGTKNLPTLLGEILNYLDRSFKIEEPISIEGFRPGIVHRLDKDTSGAIVWAKNSKSQEHLAKQFQEKTNLREYIAIVHGDIGDQPREVESYQYRDPFNRLKKINIDIDSYREILNEGKKSLGTAKYAKSLFSKIASYEDGKLSIAKVKLFTGRTHQIRTHAEWIKFPVLGDTLYGKSKLKDHFNSLPENLKEILLSLKRQMLHARVLGFTHPTTGKKLAFKAPFPEDMKKILTLLMGKD